MLGVVYYEVMTAIYIKNGNVILNDRIVNGASVAISGERISAAGKGMKAKKGSFVIDAKGCFVSPGFIDCHIHGEPEKIFSNEIKYGTTAFVVSQSCADLSFIYKRAQKLKQFIKSSPLGENVLGLRLEGPYINREKAGAQNTTYIKKPDIKELASIIAKCSPILKIITIAPELKGAQPLIRLLRKNGIIASLGHSDATFEAALSGIDAGITHATHIFNAMSPIDRRDPGAAGAALLDGRVRPEIILDLIHVHHALFGLLLKMKKKDSVIIVTDSLASESWTGVEKTGGAYRFKDGRLAGSCLTMIQALKNAVKYCGVPLLDAIRLITLNPANLLGVGDKKGSIAAGKDADIVVFDKDFDVKNTIIRGRMVYNEATRCAG